MSDIKDHITLEREFLHSISTPLMISMSQLEFVLAKKDEMSLEQITEKVNKAKAALDKVSASVHERRAKIKSLVNA
jgi:cell division protein FtsB